MKGEPARTFRGNDVGDTSARCPAKDAAEEEGAGAQSAGTAADRLVEDLAGHPAQPTGPPVEDAEVVEEQLTGQRKDSAATEAKRWRKGY